MFMCQSYGCPIRVSEGQTHCIAHTQVRLHGSSRMADNIMSSDIIRQQFALANANLMCKHPGCTSFVGAPDILGYTGPKCKEHSRQNVAPAPETMADKYPKYYKLIPTGWRTVDTYAVNKLFPVDDPSGCILHARKKLLVPGTRTGGKSMRKDITEARDTLNRWLELNPE